MKVSECKTYDIETKSTVQDVKFLKITDAPFKIYGVTHDGEGFTRMPKEIAEGASESVRKRYRNTAGGRLRFNTNSRQFCMAVKLGTKTNLSFLTYHAASSFDVYAGVNHVSSVRCHPEELYYEFDKDTRNGGRAVITMNFPLFDNVEEVYVGLSADADVWEAEDTYETERPVVFYGAGVTQGIAGSRPGMTVGAQLGREFNFDHLNFGFYDGLDGSGVMADYLSGLDMTALVYDCDEKAAPEELARIYEPTFLKFREKQPKTPVVFLTSPYLEITEDVKRRYDIVKGTYENALKSGDKNVYFVDAYGFFPEDLRLSDMTPDGKHFNDIALYYIKEAVKPVIAKILGK